MMILSFWLFHVVDELFLLCGNPKFLTFQLDRENVKVFVNFRLFIITFFFVKQTFQSPL